MIDSTAYQKRHANARQRRRRSAQERLVRDRYQAQHAAKALQQALNAPWRHSPRAPGVRYARLRATSSTYGVVTLIVVEEARREQFYVMCLETALSAPRLVRA
jgi:hypothetical protein